MRILFALIFLLVLVTANAMKIDVSIYDHLGCEISSLTYNTSNNLTEFLIELDNTGSVGYNIRPRIDILSNNMSIFTGWGKEHLVMPGERRASKIFWYNKPGNYTLRIRAYFGNEILEHNENIIVSAPALAKSVFDIEDLRVYEDFIIFDIVSNEPVKDLIVIPEDYISGWIFEQAAVESICKGCRTSLLINYNPSAWIPTNVKLAVVSDSGRYYTEGTFDLNKDRGIGWIFFYLIDSIKMLMMQRT